MGSALTYARRYALFALVGIAVEDDLDAPDLLLDAPQQSGGVDKSKSSTRSPKGILHRPTPLGPEHSALLRNRMLAEVASLSGGDDSVSWAKNNLPAKSTLTEQDAHVVEAAYQETVLKGTRLAEPSDSMVLAKSALDGQTSPEASLIPKGPVRKRNKAHLLFVGTQPCLICQQMPSDAHHIKFAQPKALGRKVSDEFAVPLCRLHNHELHRHGNEQAWWTNMQIVPLEIAKQLWETSPVHRDVQGGYAPKLTRLRPEDSEVLLS
jgi:hypothetical protein